MAISATNQSGGSDVVTGGRRFAIGLNVGIAIAAATGVLIALNWFSSIKHYRKDLASMGSYGLSQRTKTILDRPHDEILISTIYERKDNDEAQQGYIDRLQDYLDELKAYAPDVKISQVTSDSQREQLRETLGSSFGSEADKHKAALADFDKLLGEIESDLTQYNAQVRALIEKESWLGDFPLFAEVGRLLESRKAELDKVKTEIAEMTPAGGIPKYEEAANRAKTALDELKKDLEGIGQFLGKLNALADEASKPDSTYIKMLHEVAVEPDALVASLREIVGAADAPAPADVTAVLKSYNNRGQEVKAALEREVRRVDAFAQKFPMVTQHPNWAATVRMGGMQGRMEVASVLQQAAESLGKSRLQILGIIDNGNPEALQKALSNVRRDVSVLEQNAAACHQLLGGLADRLTAMDPGSKALLDQSRDGQFFKARLDAVAALDKRLGELPALQLGSIADQLKESNIVVVQSNNKVRVVSFNDAFPVRESIGGPNPMGDSEKLGRTFNGDGAISSAILSTMTSRPFATIVLTGYEPPAPQQRSPFMPPPPQSRVPMSELSELRKRLETASFKVVDWNMATTPDAPKPEEGTENVYVLLPPPPPSPPNPFDQSHEQEKKFGEPERKKIRDILDKGGRAVFFAAWEFQRGSMFGGGLESPEYGYDQLLSQDWGLDVVNEIRVVWVNPEVSKPNSFSVAGPRFAYMPAGGFTDEPIGKPLRGTRFLVNDACPIEATDKLPEGVKHQTLLRLEESENYIAAKVMDIVKIVDMIRDTSSNGVVTLERKLDHGPFDLAVAAERKDGDTDKGRIVVIGFGGSLIDGYVTQPVIRQADKIQFDPPPTENMDFVVNALYWLQGQEKWISRGPVPRPTLKPISKDKMFTLRTFVMGIWPALVFVPGIVFWYVRRR